MALLLLILPQISPVSGHQGDLGFKGHLKDQIFSTNHILILLFF